MSKVNLWRKSLFTLRRESRNKQVPWLEWYLGRLAGAALVWTAKKALRRGDVHEFNHCCAVIEVGNTDGDHHGCPLDTGQTINMKRMELVVHKDALDSPDDEFAAGTHVTASGHKIPFITDKAKEYLAQSESLSSELFDVAGLFRTPVTNNTPWFDHGDPNQPIYEVGEFIRFVIDAMKRHAVETRAYLTPLPEDAKLSYDEQQSLLANDLIFDNMHADWAQRTLFTMVEAILAGRQAVPDAQ